MTRGLFLSRLPKHLLILAIAVGLILFSSWGMSSMGDATAPGVAPRSSVIQTEALGLSEVDVGSLVSGPIEQVHLNGVAWLDGLKPGLSNVEIDATRYRLANSTESAIEEVKKSLFNGAILVVLWMALILLDWLVDIFSLMGIPLAFLAALAVLHLRGSPMSSMLFAIPNYAFGAVLVGAIFVSENFRNCHFERRDEGGDESTTSIHCRRLSRGPRAYRIRNGELDCCRDPRLLLRRYFQIVLEKIAKPSASALLTSMVAGPRVNRFWPQPFGVSKVDFCSLERLVRLEAARNGCVRVRLFFVRSSACYWTSTARGGALG